MSGETQKARDLRNNATPSERRLWNALKSRGVGGAKFSRQIKVGPFYCDFLCREHGLAIELDGESHNHRVTHDARRTCYLEQGLTVLRFGNLEIRDNLDGVVTAILQALPPTPPAAQAAPPRTGRGEL